MKILLLGKNGQVGWELQRALAPLGEVVALDRRTTPAADLSNPDSLAAIVRDVRPDAIVNAAAHTAVDKAETEADLARAVNTTAPAVLAREAAALGAWLVHYSTDYVFDGGGTAPWTENAPVGPLSVYGQTKADGEAAIRFAGGRHLIFRTSWVYAARGGNFAKTMLRLARERDRMTVVSDQFGAPTGADLIADVTAHALRTAAARPEVSGTYHLVAGGETTWHGYASHVIDRARTLGQDLRVQTLDPVPTSAFPTPARRPANSRLDTTRLRQTFGLVLPPWQQGVDRLLDEVLTAP